MSKKMDMMKKKEMPKKSMKKMGKKK